MHVNHPGCWFVAGRVDRPASTAVVVLLLAVGCRSTAAPADRFELDGKAIRADFFAVEGNGELPVPGDVLKWPLVVIDDVADLVCETVPSNRSYRRTGAGAKLVAIEVAAASDLAVLTDDEAGGLRGIEFVRWDPAMARELRRVDARRCMFTFGPFSDVVDLLALPTTTRYLHMQDAKPVDPAGFARFPELRYLAVPNEAFVPDGEPPPALEDDSSPGPAIAVDWTCVLPELRWLDLECVGADLRPLAGHPRLRTVLAAHCRIEKMPTRVHAGAA